MPGKKKCIPCYKPPALKKATSCASQCYVPVLNMVLPSACIAKSTNGVNTSIGSNQMIGKKLNIW
jgi:hypothetical protein